MIPTRAYDLLNELEKRSVDEYVEYAVNEQHRKRERIVHALHLPIPTEYIRRSKDALYKPLVLAAVAERLRELADEQDISPSRVIKEHASIAFSNIEDYIDAGAFGQIQVKDINRISTEKMAAVKSIEVKPGAFGLHTKIIMHDKHPSLKAMGELMGLVAPDKPPALFEYVQPPKVHDELTARAPDKLYSDMLEQMNNG